MRTLRHKMTDVLRISHRVFKLTHLLQVREDGGLRMNKAVGGVIMFLVNRFLARIRLLDGSTFISLGDGIRKLII